MQKLIGLLFGWVEFSVTGKVTYFLNLCIRNKLPVYSIRPGEIMICRIRAPLYKKLRSIAKKSDVKIHLIKKSIMAKKYSYIKKQKGVIIGICIFSALLLIMSKFVWVYSVHSEDIGDPMRIKIEQSLDELGAKVGTYRTPEMAEKLETKLMDRFSELCWVGVNDYGSSFEIQYRLKKDPPTVEKDKSDLAYQLCADRAGVITKTQVYGGKLCVNIGDGVVKGQLLASAAAETKSGYMLTHTYGKVYAETTRTLSCSIPMTENEISVCGEPICQKKISVFNLDIPLSINIKDNANKYNILSQKSYLSNNYVKLPAYYEESWLTPVVENEVTITENEAKARGEKDLLTQEENLNLDGNILNRVDTFEVKGNILTINRVIKCEENIAREQRIFVNLT